MNFEVDYIQGGKRHSLTVDARSEADIRAKLRQEGKLVVGVRRRYFTGRSRVKTEDMIALYTALGDLLSSGVPLSRALESATASLEKGTALATVMSSVTAQVREGQPLSVALTVHESVFGGTVIAMFMAGENAGRLGQTMLTAADYVRQMAAIKGELYKKLTYPAVIFVVAMGALLFNTTFIVPKLLKSEMFAKQAAKQDTALTLLTLMSKAAPFACILVALAVFGAYYCFKNFQERTERVMVRLPGVRELVFYRSYFISFSSLANLLGVGVRLDAAISIVADSTRLFTVREELQAARNALKDGLPFSRALKSLDAIERTMLDTAQNVERVRRNFELISARFYRLYLAKIQSLAPKVYALTMVLGLGVFILMLLGIMLPYFKMLNGVSAQ